jgi:hypothetical protein
MSALLSINEAPTDGTRFLAYCPDLGKNWRWVIIRRRDSFWVDDDTDVMSDRIEGWLPLPTVGEPHAAS